MNNPSGRLAATTFALVPMSPLVAAECKVIIVVDRGCALRMGAK